MEKLEQTLNGIVNWVGSTTSVIVHTFVFILTFSTYFLGVPIATILLVLTTIVSLEAIYLSIFVQMTVNKHSGDIDRIHTHLRENR